MIAAGAFLVALGAGLVLFSIVNISHHPLDMNSPFLWIFLLAGIGFAGLGTAIFALQ